MNRPTELTEFVSELDELADNIIEQTEEFFESISVGHSIGGMHLEGEWATPDSEERELQKSIVQTYREWYHGSRVLISEYMSRSLDEFEEYKETFLNIVTLDVDPFPRSPMRTYSNAHDVFVSQRGMVNAVPRKVESERLKVKNQISKSVAKDELERSWMLFDEDLLRASGVVAGVALERHLLTMCQESDVSLDYNTDDGITSLAHTLYDGEVIEHTTLSSLETLASIRADCAHANQSEPNEHKVRRLLNDTEDYVRGRGL